MIYDSGVISKFIIYHICRKIVGGLRLKTLCLPGFPKPICWQLNITCFYILSKTRRVNVKLPLEVVGHYKYPLVSVLLTPRSSYRLVKKETTSTEETEVLGYKEDQEEKGEILEELSKVIHKEKEQVKILGTNIFIPGVV